jgi:TPR repeat protein
VVPAASAVLFILGLSVFVYRAFDTPTPPTPAAPIEAPVQQSASRAPQPAPDDNQSANNQPASLQADSAATAMRRGQEAMALGDIQGARALFEQAAQTGDPAAALAAGKTYDPDFLPRHPVPSTLPDRAKAMAWYKRAAAQGDGDAASLLARAKRLPRQ